MTNENDKIRVRIMGSERMHYDQIVTMTRKEWEELKATPERDIVSSSFSPLNALVDVKDAYDWDGFENVEMAVVDDDDKPVKPEDCYEGGS